MDTMNGQPIIIDGEPVRRRRVLIQPAMLLVMISVGLTAPITIQYLNYRVYLNHNVTKSSKSNCVNNTDDNEGAEDEVHQEVATLSLTYSAGGAFPMLISTTIFATMSDSIGRKIPLILSSVGILIHYLSFIVVAYFNLDVWVIVISNFLLNWCGGYELFFSVALAIVADTADRRERTMKFIVIQTIVMCGSGAAQIGVGYWLKATGYIPPFLLAALLISVTIPYVLIMIPETVVVKQSISSGFKSFFSSVKKLFILNENQRRAKLILLFVCHFLVFLSVITYFMPLMTMKVLVKPFCWDSVLIGYYSAAQPIFNGIGLLVGGIALKQCLGDYGMILVGLLSGILLMTGAGFAKTAPTLFALSGIGSLRNIPIAVLMSRLSKTVSDEQQGTLFAFVGALEGLGLVVGPLAFGSIYKMTSDSFPPAVFITMTGILSIPVVIICLLKFMDYKTGEPTYTRLNVDPETEEDVTVAEIG